MDFRDGGALLRAVYRCGILVQGEINGRFLRRWKQRAPHRQRHGNRGRLDECRLLYLHGRAHRFHGPRRLCLSARMDRRLRLARAAARALSPKIRQIHRPGFRRRPVLFASSAGCRRGVRHLCLVYLRRGTDARCRHRLLPIPERRYQCRRFHRHGHRLLLRRARRDERHHLHASSAVLRANLRLPRACYLYLYPDYRQRDSANGARRKSRRWLGHVSP